MNFKSIAHEGKVIIFSQNSTGEIIYTIRQSGFENNALDGSPSNNEECNPFNPENFEDWATLVCDDSRFDESNVDFMQKEFSYIDTKKKVHHLITPVYGQDKEGEHLSKKDAFEYNGLSKVIPISALGFLNVFRVSKEGYIVLNRYVLDGMNNILIPKLEVRYRRSGTRYLEKTNKKQDLNSLDTLNYKDVNNESFYEPTYRLNFLGKIDPRASWFSVNFSATGQSGAYRWNFFVHNSKDNAIVLNSVLAKEDYIMNFSDLFFDYPSSDSVQANRKVISGIKTYTLNLGSVRLVEDFDTTLYQDYVNVELGGENDRKKPNTKIPTTSKLMLALPVVKEKQDASQANIITLDIDLGIDGLPKVSNKPNEQLNLLRGNVVSESMPISLLEEGTPILSNKSPLETTVSALRFLPNENKVEVLVESDVSSFKIGDTVVLPSLTQYNAKYLVVSESHSEEDGITSLALSAENDDITVLKKAADEKPTADSIGIAKIISDAKKDVLLFDNMVVGYEMIDDQLLVDCVGSLIQQGDQIQISGAGKQDGVYPIKDIDAQSNTLTIQFPWEGGKVINLSTFRRRGLQFNDERAHILVSKMKELQFDKNQIQFSFSVWVYIRELPTGSQKQTILLTANNQLQLFVEKEGIVHAVFNFDKKSTAKNIALASKNAIQKDSWNFISFSVSSNIETSKVSIQLYLAGKLDVGVEKEVHDLSWTNDAWLLGGSQDNKKTSTALQGSLSDASFWSTALTAQQMAVYMHSVPTNHENNLVALLPLGGLVEAGNGDRSTPSIFNFDYDAQVLGDICIRPTIVQNQSSSGDSVVGYENDGLINLKPNNLYEESFEFRLRSGDAFLKSKDILDAEGKNKIFDINLWGKITSESEKKQNFQSLNITVDSIDNGWLVVRLRFLLPQDLRFFRLFHIENLKGKWDFLDLRNYRLKNMSDTITHYNFKMDLPITQFSNAVKKQEKNSLLDDLQTNVSLSSKNVRTLSELLDDASQDVSSILNLLKSRLAREKEKQEQIIKKINEVKASVAKKKKSDLNYMVYSKSFMSSRSLVRRHWKTNAIICSKINEEWNNLSKKGSNSLSGQFLFFFDLQPNGYYRMRCDNGQYVRAISNKHDDYLYYLTGNKRDTCFYAVTPNVNGNPPLSDKSYEYRLQDAQGGSFQIHDGSFQRYVNWRNEGNDGKENLIWWDSAPGRHWNEYWFFKKTGYKKGAASVVNVKNFSVEIKERKKLDSSLAKCVENIKKFTVNIKELEDKGYNKQQLAAKFQTAQTKHKAIVKDMHIEAVAGLRNSNLSGFNFSDTQSSLVMKAACVETDGLMGSVAVRQSTQSRVELNYVNQHAGLCSLNLQEQKVSTEPNNWLPAFDNIGSYIFLDENVLNLDNSISFNNEWTMETWFYFPPHDVDSLWNVLACSKDGASRVGIFNSSRLVCVIKDVFYDSGYDLKTISLGWHHLALVSRSDGLHFYIDGMPSKTAKRKNNILAFHPKNKTSIATADDSNFAIQDGFFLSFWVKVNQAETGNLFSYLVDNKNVLTVKNTSQLEVILDKSSSASGKNKTLSLDKDNSWHNISISWLQSTGDLLVWKDGKFAYNVHHFAKGFKLPSKGKFVVGEAGIQARFDSIVLLSAPRLPEEVREDLYKDYSLGDEPDLLHFWDFESFNINKQKQEVILEDKAEKNAAHLVIPKAAYNAKNNEYSISVEKINQNHIQIDCIGNSFKKDAPFGSITRFAVWDTALSQNELMANMYLPLEGQEYGLNIYLSSRKAPMGVDIALNNSDTVKGKLSDYKIWSASTLSLPRLDRYGSSFFNNVAEKAVFEQSASIDVKNGFSLEFWLKELQGENSSRLSATLQYKSDKTSGMQTIAIGNVSEMQSAPLTGKKTSNQAVADNTSKKKVIGKTDWVHIALVVPKDDLNKLYVYKDGVVIKEVALNAASSIECFTLEKSKGVVALSELRLWKMQRSAEQLSTYKTYRFINLKAFPENLFLYYSLTQPQAVNADDNVLDSADAVVKIGEFYLYQDQYLPIGSKSFNVCEYTVVGQFVNESYVAPVLKGALYAYALNSFILPEKRLQEIEQKWVGNAQFEPTIIGYIEGAPPVPSENLVLPINYNDLVYLQFSVNKDTEYQWEATRNFSQGADIDLSVGAAWDVNMQSGIGVSVSKVLTRGFAGFKGRLNMDATETRRSSITSRSSVNVMNRMSLRGYSKKDKRFEHLGDEIYVPKNIGYALVESAMADVFLLRLKGSQEPLSYDIRPVEDIPRDLNIIEFLINPHYTLNGSLDGQIGFEPALDQLKHVPEMRAKYGSLYPASYFRLKETYDLISQLERQDKARRAYFDNFDVTVTSNSLENSLPEDSLNRSEEDKYNVEVSSNEKNKDSKQKKEANVDFGEMDEKKNNLKSNSANQKNRVQKNALFDKNKKNEALASLSGWQKKMENILLRSSKRNLVNSYVWSADGGFYSEEQSFMDMTNHSIGGSFTLGGALGAIADITVMNFKLDLIALYNISLNQTLTKSTQNTSLVNLDINMMNLENREITDEKMRPLYPGEKVSKYRFKTFYLEPSVEHFKDFFDYIVDAEWLMGNNENARALRQAQGSKPNKAWRIFHRVTYVERALLAGVGRNMTRSDSLNQSVDLITRYLQVINEKTDLIAGQSSLVNSTIEESSRSVMNQSSNEATTLANKQNDILVKIEELLKKKK